MVDWQGVATDIANSHGISFDPTRVSVVKGGSVAASYRCEGSQASHFVKCAPADSLGWFAAEAEGLAALADAAVVRVPGVRAVGVSGACAYLVSEWIDFDSPSCDAHARLGVVLAQLHRITASQHGWRRANFIGATPQMNAPTPNWAQFYHRCRLRPQLALAHSRGFEAIADRGEALARRLDHLLGHDPAPALLHGDLWGGNWSADQGGQPVVFDPAVYFGDRETDLAMARLFSGFDAQFYAAYEHAWPLPAGWQDRLPAYQLYHVLNHLNLFGGGYLNQTIGLLDRLEDLV